MGTIKTSGGTQIIAGHTGPDPGPGGLNPVLIYNLPFSGFQGDVFLSDLDLNGAILDVLRFNGDGTVIFYSDNLDGFDALADTPAPPQSLYNSTITIPELVSGDAFYTPGPEQPGWDRTNPTYHFISDGNTPVVPEPCSLALLALGGLPMLRRLRRKPSAE